MWGAIRGAMDELFGGAVGGTIGVAPEELWEQK
jgi:hypothetical protein